MNALETPVLQIEIREDRIELTLNERRNKLLFADIIISIVGVLLAFVGAVAGLFGMNLNSGLCYPHLPDCTQVSD